MTSIPFIVLGLACHLVTGHRAHHMGHEVGVVGVRAVVVCGARPGHLYLTRNACVDDGGEPGLECFEGAHAD